MKFIIIYMLTLWLAIGQPFIFNTCMIVGAEPPSSRHLLMPSIMSVKDFIHLVVERNETIRAERLDYTISREAVRIEKAVFEPKLVTGYQQAGEKIKYSQAEKSSLLFAPELNELSTHYNATIESTVPTGATVRLGYNLKDSRDIALDEKDEYMSYLGIEVTQPLLKGGGMAATAKINIAEMDSSMAFQKYRQTMLEVVLDSALTCWDYYEAHEKLKIRQDSVAIATQILEDNRERIKLGKMAKIEELVAEAGLAQRKSQECRARQDLLTVSHKMRSFISSSAIGIAMDIEFNDQERNDEYTPDFNTSIKKTFHYRPDYLSARERVERESLLVRYTKNQILPQLDVTGSYGLNGLEDSAEDSWRSMFDEDYSTWSVGAQLTVPLLGGLHAKSHIASATARQKQAMLDLQLIEIEIENIVYTAIENIYSAREQLANYTHVKNLNKQLLDVELRMLASGKSDSRAVLDKEQNFIDAREVEVESFVNYKKAILNLAMAEGVLLERFGVEVMGREEK